MPRSTVPVLPAVLLGLLVGLTPVLAAPASAATPDVPVATGVALVGGAGIAVRPSQDLPTGYRVYKQDGEGAWQLLAQIPDYAVGSPYKDTALTPGETGTYAVSALNADGESSRSAAFSVARPLVDPVAGPVNAVTLDAASFAGVHDAAAGASLSTYRTELSASLGGVRASFTLPPVPGPGSYPISAAPVQGSVVVSAGWDSISCTLTSGTLTVTQALFGDDLAPLLYDGEVKGACAGGTAVSGNLRWHASRGYAAATGAPTTLSLRAVPQQATTAPMTVTNRGTLPLPVGTPVVEPLDPSTPPTGLSAATDCGSELAVGASCTVGVTFDGVSPAVRAVLAVPVGTPAGVLRAEVAARTYVVPDAPGALAVTAVVHRNYLTWGRPYNLDTADVTGYRIYRSVDGAPGTLLTTAAGSPYYDRTAEPGHSYLYAVTATSPAGESAPTAVVGVTGAFQSLVHVTGGGLSETPVGGGTRVPLADASSHHATPAVSADGLSVAYARQTSVGGTYDLFLRRLDGTSAITRLTNTPTVDELDPAWSPDGRTLAFTAAINQGSIVTVRTMPAAGGASTLVTGDVSDPAWLPDGRTLIVTGQSTERLERLTLSGVKTAVPGGSGGFAAAVSPLGDTLAFNRFSGQRTGLFRLPVGGGTPVELATANDWYEPAFAPDGTAVFGEVAPDNASPGLGRVPLLGAGWGTPAQITTGFVFFGEEDLEPTVGGARVALGAPVVRAGSVSVPVRVPAGTTATCSLDNAAATACGATWSRTGLSTGTHVLRVRATGAGRPTTVATAWIPVDATAPVLRLGALPAVTLTTSVRLAFSASDASGVHSYDVRYRRAARGGTYSAYAVPAGWAGQTAAYRTFSVSPGTEYCLSVRARDRQGNTTPWSTDRCTATPVDDRSLTASSGWTRQSATAFYRGTATAAARTGVSLSLPGVAARRVSLVATTCATCGSVQVYLAGKLLGTVSLRRAGATTHKVVLPLPLLAANRAGTLVLRTTSSAPVRVDGVALRKS